MGKFKELEIFIKENLLTYTEDFIERLCKEFSLEKKDFTIGTVNNETFFTITSPIGIIDVTIETKPVDEN